MKNQKIPEPTVSRLCKIYSLLQDLKEQGHTKISSSKIGKLLGISAHSIRKDLNHFGDIGNTGSGYEINTILQYINENLSFNKERNACVIGLGKLGTAILQYKKLEEQHFKLIAGFDSNINKLETIKTNINLYPAYDIANIVKEKNIELAILSVPGNAAYDTAKRAIKGGIKGIINFSPIILSFPNDTNVNIKNVDLVDDLRFLSAMTTLNHQN